MDIPELWGFFEGLLVTRPFDKLAECGQSNLIDKKGEKTVTFFGDKEGLLKDVDFRQWTDYEITVQDTHIVVFINGRKVAELIDQRDGKAAQSGILAISLHPLSEMTLQLKDIELKKLSSSLAATQETVNAVIAINLIDKLKTEIESGSEQKALTLLQQNPWLTNLASGEKTNANDPGSTQQSPLLLASARGRSEVVKWLIANGAGINQEGYNNFTPMDLAENGEIAQMLIAAGASLSHVDAWGNTPLQNAAGAKRLDVIEAIIKSGYRMDPTSAILIGRNDLVAKMIQEDSSIVNNPKMAEKEAAQQERETPLMVAVGQGEKKAVEILLDAGADVNEKYQLGFRSGPPHCGTVTALSIAVVLKKIDLIELLLQFGANPAVDCDGSSLLEYSRKYCSPEVVTLLEKEWPKKTQ